MSNQASLTGRYAPREGSVLTKQVAQEMVIVDMQRGVYHGLNPVGVFIWEQLDGTRPLSEIADELATHYPKVDKATIEADTLSLVQALLDHELVTAH